MKKSTKCLKAALCTVLAIFMSACPIWQAHATSQEPTVRHGNCLLVVDGYKYISGDDCTSSVSMSQTIVSNASYSALVQFATGDEAQAFWNGPFQDDRASQPLGEVVRDGDCWLNKRTKICVIGRVHATLAECELNIRGRKYISGKCPLETYRHSGSFYMNDTCKSISPFSASVMILAKDKASGRWSGDPPQDYASVDLGTLTRKGACWVNEVAKICASRTSGDPVEACRRTSASIPTGADESELAYDRFEPAGQCEVNVGGHEYISGRCGVMLDRSSVVVFGADLSAGYKAVIRTEHNVTTGAWNGSFGQKDFVEDLGVLDHIKNCWNASSGAKICIFKPSLARLCAGSDKACDWHFQN